MCARISIRMRTEMYIGDWNKQQATNIHLQLRPPAEGEDVQELFGVVAGKTDIVKHRRIEKLTAGELLHHK